MSQAVQSTCRPPRYSRWRAATLATVYLLMAVHILHWKLSGKTLAPLELNEVMYTLELGIVTAGFIFMVCAVLATLIFGRFFCSWGCHILALEDLSAWILEKMHIRPKPVRSRVLIWVPIIAMLYMFAWPQLSRLVSGEPAPALHLRTDTGGWASFVTTNFWRNLPGPGITLITFAVCGFVIVYFLGSRAFCTYACPYGAVFSLADRIAPGRIMARGDCTKCGKCTAVCQSRVRVHEELIEFGRVVNPSCLKDLDCIAACPEGALGYGFGLPAVFEHSKSSRLRTKQFDFTIREDLLIAGVFIASLAIFRGLYQTVPFLLSLAIGGILGYVAVLSVRLLHLKHVKINNFQLKIGDGLTRSGMVFIGLTAIAAGLTVHSAFIRYHEFQGGRHFQLAHVADEQVDDAADAAAEQSLSHLEFCNDWGFHRPPGLTHQLAVLHAAIGRRLANNNDIPQAIEHLEKSCVFDPDVALVRYNLGVLLATTGRSKDALAV
ncbi:MAG: 4Fe-4S binding protein [Planctomycetes bacterium]|nr:4Fe-4S binding protein [Planctomycetota bacterium]